MVKEAKYRQFCNCCRGLLVVPGLWAVGVSLQALLTVAIANPDIHLPTEDVPTMHWASQRFGMGVVDNWRVFSRVQLVRVFVSDGWYSLPYFDRYRMVMGMGNVAARRDYRLVVMQSEGRVVATYECNGSGEERRCEIDLNPVPNPL